MKIFRTKLGDGYMAQQKVEGYPNHVESITDDRRSAIASTLLKVEAHNKARERMETAKISVECMC